MAAIEGHSVVPWNGTAQVFGGKNRRDEYTADLWEVTVGAQGAVWKRVVASGEAPSPRAYHGATLWRNRYLMVVGGVGVDVDISLVHVLDLEEKVWRTREAGGDVPIPRCHHTLNATHHEDQLLLYGGYPVGESERLFSSGHVQPEHRPFFEVYSLDLTGADLAWRRVRCVEEFPPTLWGHTASLYFNNLIVFGGVDVVDNKESSLACVWHVDKQQWRWVEFNVAPQARALHSAVMYKGCVLTFGGFGLTNTCKFNDTWSFSLETGQWVELAAGGEIPCPRSGHAAYMIDDQLIVLGGVDAEHKRLNDVHVLNLQTASWRRLPVQVQGMEMHQVSSPAPPAYPDKMQGIEKAQMLLNRAAAQGAEYEGLHRKHFSTTTRPDEAAVSPPRTHPLPMREPPSQLHSAPPPSHPKFLPPQPVYDKSLENIVPFSDPTQIADNRHTSPRRGLEGVPPPPPPPQQGGFGRGPEVSFTQSVQTEVDGGGGGGVVALPPTNADPGLEREAADLIQSQRQEIEMLRAMLEDKKSPDSGALGPHTAPGEYLPHQLPGPPAPRISLTKETLVDMMPNLLGTSIIDTPSLSLPRTGKEGLMSRDAIQGLIDRRLNGHNVPILYVFCCPTRTFSTFFLKHFFKCFNNSTLWAYLTFQQSDGVEGNIILTYDTTTHSGVCTGGNCTIPTILHKKKKITKQELCIPTAESISAPYVTSECLALHCAAEGYGPIAVPSCAEAARRGQDHVARAEPRFPGGPACARYVFPLIKSVIFNAPYFVAPFGAFWG